MSLDPGLIDEDDGPPIHLTTNWAKSLLYRMGFVKRKGIKEQFLFDIEVVVKMEDIPDDLILNWDHTTINIVPVSSWTMNQKGEK